MVMEFHAMSVVLLTTPSTHADFISTFPSEHRANAPMKSCMPRMPNRSQNSSDTSSTLARPGSELKSAFTTTLSSGTRLMTRRGRRTRMVRRARTHPRFCPSSALPTIPMTTMKPSMQFQASRRYAESSPKYKPYATSFMAISSVKMMVNRMSTPPSAEANEASSGGKGTED